MPIDHRHAPAMWRLMGLLLLALLAPAHLARSQQAAAGEPAPSTAPEAQPDEAPPAPPRPVLQNHGKPMLIPFACTDDDIQWGGLTCSDSDPCPVYLELTAIASADGRIFAAGNIHASAVTLYSVLLGSEDGGKTWQEVSDRVRGAGLDHLYFFDAQNGWATGESLYPLAQDPFLFITSDGGKTWRQQPVFSETHPGTIQQFWFTSKTEGSLIIDRGQGSETERYELYESPDGGESWHVRQVSTKPIPTQGAPATAADWRVRADGPTRSFQLELRQGDRWSPVASFLVSLGPCKLPPPPAEAAPPDVPAPAPETTPAASPRRAPSLRRPR
ncbi:MAG TPA: hypothetical protein VG675_00385 [Bryobacteraceae bacterium]|nr:hypothetical protein [Bryobacteraceae bacterium]